MVVPRQSEGEEKFAKSETTSRARAALMVAGTYGKNGPESKQVKVDGEEQQGCPTGIEADGKAGMTGGLVGDDLGL